jgi:glutathione synthase/RimK-type ligase-like ATP-grasp enzyme
MSQEILSPANVKPRKDVSKRPGRRIRRGGKSILVLTNPWDSTADRVSVALRDRKAWVFRLDTAEIPLQCAIVSKYGSNNPQKNLIIREYGPCIDLEEIDSIWYRRPGGFRVNPILTGPARRFALGEAEMALSGVLRNTKAFWMNHPSSLGEARYKLVQLAKAERLRLRIPDTVVTNDPDVAHEFATSHPGGVVVKAMAESVVAPVGEESVEPGIIPTSEVKTRDRDAFAAVKHTPCLLQELIPKKYDIRVTIVGKKLFPVAIYSQDDVSSAIDWRLKGPVLPHEEIDLPEDIQAKLLDLANSFNLNYAAIDMIRSVNDEYVFLEVNPNGQWEWIEVLTSLPIADTIAATLISQGS